MKDGKETELGATAAAIVLTALLGWFLLGAYAFSRVQRWEIAMLMVVPVVLTLLFVSVRRYP